jgi:hypothetical protein
MANLNTEEGEARKRWVVRYVRINRFR